MSTYFEIHVNFRSITLSHRNKGPILGVPLQLYSLKSYTYFESETTLYTLHSSISFPCKQKRSSFFQKGYMPLPE